MYLKNNGEVSQSITFDQWLSLQNIITEPAISKRIKDIVFEYFADHPLYKSDLAGFQNFDTMANKTNRQIHIKKVSIYLYYQTFGAGAKKIFSYNDIAELHNTSKQNAMAAAESIKGYIEVDKSVASDIQELTKQINERMNQNTLKFK